MDLTLFVKRGDPITAELWNRLVAAVRMCRLRSGPGVRLRTMPDGTLVSFDPGNAIFSHPFRVIINGQNTASLLPGTVNGVAATIKGVPLDGDDAKGKPAPVLDFKKPQLDADGRGYIAAEISCDKKWNVQSVEIVQVANLDSVDGKPPKDDKAGGPYKAGGIAGLPGRKVRQPLAMLRQRKNGQLDLFQITFFNLQHRADVRDSSSEIARHFFWPE